MKWKIIFSILGVATLAVGIYTWSAVHQALSSDTIPAVEKNKVTATTDRNMPIKNTVKEADELFPMDMTEANVRNAIHQMSHQKVRADQMWQKYSKPVPLTDNNIKRLIEVIEKNDYVESSTYLDILNRWQQHDFSEADVDHNIIWHMQNGDQGEATGLATHEEEKQYIKENFDNND